jgi:hypothetical protein
MAENSMPPPSSGGGYGKYLVVLLLLVAGGLGAFLVMKPKNEPKPPPPEPPKVERSTALVDEALEIPDPIPDAGPAQPVAEPTKPKRTGGGGGNSWECAGDIPQQQIKQVLADSQVQVRSCYERRLRNNNLLRGNVSLEVKIGAGGKVVATRTRGTLGDKEVYSCMQSLAKNWTFPPPSGGQCAVFNAPYNFTPKN